MKMDIPRTKGCHHAWERYCKRMKRILPFSQVLGLVPNKAVQCIKGRKLTAKDGCVTGRCRTPSCDNLIISQNTYSASMYCYCQKVSDLFAYSLPKVGVVFENSVT